MRIVLWIVTALVVLIGTVFVAVAAAAAGWAAGEGSAAVAQGAGEAARAMGQIQLPDWLVTLAGLEWVSALRALANWSAGAWATAAPWLLPVLGWVAPVLWIVWGIAVLIILALAAVIQVALSPSRKSRIDVTEPPRTS